MKKLFTLIAALVAIASVNAQNLWSNADGVAVDWSLGEAAVSADAISALNPKAGDKIVVTVSEKTGADSDWPSVYVRTQDQGMELGSCGLWNYSEYPVKFAVTLTDNSIKAVKSSGIGIFGAGGKVSSVDFESSEIPEGMDLTGAVWMDLNATMIDNWANTTIPASAFSTLSEGGNVQLRVTEVCSGTEWSDNTFIKIYPNGWDDSKAFDTSGSRFVLDEATKTYTFVPTADEIASMQTNGMIVCGLKIKLYAVALGIDDPTKEITKDFATYTAEMEEGSSFEGKQGSSGWNCPGWIGGSGYTGTYKTLVFEYQAEHEFRLCAQNWPEGNQVEIFAAGTNGETKIIAIPVGDGLDSIHGLGQYAISNRYVENYETDYMRPYINDNKQIEETYYGANTVKITRAYLTSNEVKSTYTAWNDPKEAILFIHGDVEGASWNPGSTAKQIGCNYSKEELNVYTSDTLTVVGDGKFAISAKASALNTDPVDYDTFNSARYFVQDNWGVLETETTLLKGASEKNFKVEPGKYIVTLTTNAENNAANNVMIHKVEEKSAVAGDVNGDGKVTVADVSAIITVICKTDGWETYKDTADVTGDGEVSVADASFVINIICNVVE